MAIVIRESLPEDVPFLAWVVLAASRSHVACGAWDLAVPGDDEEKLRFLERLLTSERPHWCQARGFRVAEVDGRAAAALSGYAPEDPGLESPAEAISACARSLGWTDEKISKAFAQLAIVLGCLPPDEPGAWIIEWVATSAGQRRRGLVQRLLEAELANGTERGHRVSQISILSGNTAAQRAYERAGYEYVDERRSAAFERAVGCPGLLRMLRPL
jgi:ribosomal protein S18 acetylase RimI-like enzyme